MAASPIDYAPGAPVRRRILAKRVVGVLLLIAIVAAAPFAWRRLQTYRAERQGRLNRELLEAAYRCDTDAVGRLLRSGADVSARWGLSATPSHMGAAQWTPHI